MGQIGEIIREEKLLKGGVIYNTITECKWEHMSAYCKTGIIEMVVLPLFPQILNYFDYFFTAIFTIEITLKVSVRQIWNILY